MTTPFTKLGSVRAILILLICLTLPLQGLALAQASEPPCPMAQAHHGDAGDSGDAGDADCCNDAGDLAATGKACKSGQECSASSYSLPAKLLVCAPRGVSGRVAAVPPLLLPAFAPADVWRPPTRA